MNSDMVKPEKFDHLHLVYHFTVPLNLEDIFDIHGGVVHETSSITKHLSLLGKYFDRESSGSQ